MCKKFLLTFIVFTIVLHGRAQDVPPPGTVKISDNTYLDKQLISFLNYDEFLFYLKTHDPQRYTEMIPIDTLVTYEGDQLWNNPEFEDHPVIGVSKDQMLAYCEWRSEVVNFMVLNKAQRSCNLSKWAQFDKMQANHKMKITYFLPNVSDLRDASVRQEKYWLDEAAIDGSYPHPPSTKISNPDFQVFRCAASYTRMQ